MEGTFKFGPDASGEIVIRDDIIEVIINDDAQGSRNYVIRLQWHAVGAPSLEVDTTDAYVYDATELIGDA